MALPNADIGSVSVSNSSAFVRSVRSARIAMRPARPEHDRVVLAGVDDGVLPVLVDGRLRRAHHARAHLDALGTHGERGRHRRAVDETAGGDDRHVDLRTDQRQQHHRRDRPWALESTALAALDDQAVDPRVDRFHRAGEVGHDVEDREPALLQHRRVLGRADRPMS